MQVTPLRSALLSAALWIGIGTVPRAADAQSVSNPPASAFDLSHWQLQLPVAAPGGVEQIDPAGLMSGYSSSYFYTGADGAMTFWCPVTGATTANTHYPRSELREMAPGGDWDIMGDHAFDATCRVLQIPGSGRIIIGQIHGHVDGSEIVKLTWDNGRVVAAVEPSRTTETGLDLGASKLGDTIKYHIAMKAGMLSVTVGAKTATYSYAAATWKTDTYYFKAGCYVQDNSGSSSEGGKVAFYRLQAAYPTALGPNDARGFAPSQALRVPLSEAGWNVAFRPPGKSAAVSPLGRFLPWGAQAAHPARP